VGKAEKMCVFSCLRGKEKAGEPGRKVWLLDERGEENSEGVLPFIFVYSGEKKMKAWLVVSFLF